MTNSLDDLIAFVEARISVLTASGVADIRATYQAILARLVSLRDAGKELPEIESWTTVSGESVVFKNVCEHFRAHAVADRVRVKELEKQLRDALYDPHTDTEIQG